MSDEDGAARRAFSRLRAAMAVTGITPPEKAVLLVLSIMANAGGECFPPVRGPKGIAARASLGDRTVARALRGLEEAGHVTTRHVDGKGSVYTVHPCQSGAGAETPAAVAGVGGRLPARQATPATLAPKQPGTATPRKTSSSKGVPAITDAPNLPRGVSTERWNEFVEMRLAMARAKPRPRPWTAGAQAGIVRDLHAIVADGGDPEAALQRSIVNGWAGVRFDKGRIDANGRGAQWRRGGRDAHPGGRDCAAALDVFGGMEG